MGLPVAGDVCGLGALTSYPVPPRRTRKPCLKCQTPWVLSCRWPPASSPHCRQEASYPSCSSGPLPSGWTWQDSEVGLGELGLGAGYVLTPTPGQQDGDKMEEDGTPGTPGPLSWPKQISFCIKFDFH